MKPVIISEPEDVTTTSGTSATFTCKVSGDPVPKITWSREEPRITWAEIGNGNGRSFITNNGMTLTVEGVTAADEGVYRCVAENEAGRVEASASLAVHSHPSFLVKPRDQRVGMNGIAKFECVADGNPPPSIFWTKEGSQDLMFQGTTHGQMHVTEDGTLTIQVRFEIRE